MPEQRREPEFTVLLVCTGNICRSALAERLGRAYLDEILGADAAVVRLISAGTQAVVGSQMHPDSALVLRGYGAEAGDFRAQQLTGELAIDAALVLTMTRLHRHDTLVIAPRALARMFTLREAADLLGLLEDDVPAGDDPGERARNLVQAMTQVRSERGAFGDADDIPDPIGQPVQVHEEVGEMISGALLPVLRRLAAVVAPDGARSRNAQSPRAGRRG